MKHTLLAITLLFICLDSYAQTLSEEETKLYSIIMEYRAANGLPQIPLSGALTYVAQTHVKDLVNNHPVTEQCNPHSWSDKGNWTPCCYTSDHSQAACIWSKPREMTNYRGNGYEILFMADSAATAVGALDAWKSSPGHNATILNRDFWGQPWNAIGIGMYQGYAVVWFGNE
jgi:uncharacterized protein YkwD